MQTPSQQKTEPFGAAPPIPPEQENSAPSYASIGPYRVLSLLGRGGMGEVVLAERDDGAYRQLVAIKLLRVGHRIDQELLLRIRQERQLLAMLEHPGIARLLGGGDLAGGDPYLVIEYIPGQRITDYCDQLELSIDARLRLFLCVCEAVQYAHQRLIVHRDIKPDNVLVTADGIPKLLDFGIAKLIEGAEFGDSNATQSGMRALTPSYCSPEQLRGESVTVATDVYLLGLLLYELLSGSQAQRPTSKRAHDIEVSVCERQPVPPSQAPGLSRVQRTTIRGDLDVIVMQALAKDPSRRFASVAALAADIRAHQQRRPISARADSRWYLLRRFLRRNALASGALLAFALLLSGALWREQSLRAAAEAARDQAGIEAQRAYVARKDADDRRAQAEAVSGFVEKMLTGAAASRSGGGPNAKIVDALGPAWTEAKTLVDDSILQYATLGAVLSRVHSSLGQYRVGYEITKEALTTVSDRLPPTNAAVIALHVEVARTSSALGQLEEALAQRQQVVTLLTTSEPPASPALLSAQRSVADVLSELGHHDRAAEMHRAVIADAARVHGADSDPLLESLVAQASFLFDQGQSSETVATLQRIVDTHRARGSGEHEQVEDALHLLALAASRDGQFAASVRITRVLLAIYAAKGEPAHTYRASSLINLAAMQIELGDLQAAQASLVEGLELVLAHVGDSHPTYRHLRYHEADLADIQGRPEHSALVLEALAELLARNVGPDSWQARQARARAWLARAQHGQARAAVAGIDMELYGLSTQVQTIPALRPIQQQLEQMRARALWLAGDRARGLDALRQAYASALADEGRYGFGPRALARQLLPMLAATDSKDELTGLQEALTLPPSSSALLTWIEALELKPLGR